VPAHCRMRVVDRDLIRGGHYGQRSCEPHLQAEHMAAPTNAAYVKKVLANSEPSTHGTSRTWRDVRLESVMRSIADIDGHRRSTPIYGKTSYCNANPELGRANCIIRFSAPFHRLSSSTPNSVHSQPKL